MFCLSLTSCVLNSSHPKSLTGCVHARSERLKLFIEFPGTTFVLEGKIWKRKCETVHSCVALGKYNISQREIGFSRRCEKASQGQNCIWPGFFTSHDLPKEGTSEHMPDTTVKGATGILTGT